MSSYVLSCCSTADLSKEKFQKRDIHYICFHYELDGVQYMDDLGETMELSEFYDRMVAGADTKTSQINADEFEAYFRGFLEQGLDILHVTLSSGISGVINSAQIAKSMLEEEYPNRKIYIVDSLGASSGYGLLMDSLAELRDQGKDIDEVYAYANANKLLIHHWFFSTDLTFYVRGGRISKASGAVGTVLGICPLLNIDNHGKLIPRFKVRTKRKVIASIVEQMKTYAENGAEYDRQCFISHSNCEEDAKAVLSLVEENFPKCKGKIEVYNIGTTIGSHTGPGTVALFFYGNERVE